MKTLPTYKESYTPTRLDFRGSLINCIIYYFTQFNTSFHFLPFRAYCLGHFDIKQQPSFYFLLRSYYENPTYI